MSDSQPTSINPADLSVLAKAAALDLPQDRHEVVAPALEMVLQMLQALDAVDLGELPPTNSFDPRWTDLG